MTCTSTADQSRAHSTPRAAGPAEAAFPGANGKIVFTSIRTTGPGVDNPTGDEEIFMMNPDGTEVTQLTTNTKREFDPAISADGQQIAFTSDRDDFRGEIYGLIFVMNRDGTRQRPRTEVGEGSQNPAWQPIP